MKVSKTDNRFSTGFPKPITGLPKQPILTSLIQMPMNSSTQLNPNKLYATTLNQSTQNLTQLNAKP